MVIAGPLFVVVLLLVIAVASANRARGKKDSGDMVLKLIYTFLIGIFLAVFVGVGIAAFYPAPKYPEAPLSIKYCSSDAGKLQVDNEELKAEAEKYDKTEREYRAKSQIYNRNVSTMALVASILIVIASLTFFKKILLIADGLLLGGVLTLLYSVIRGFEADDNMFRFVVVSIGLIISLFLGYVKFIKAVQKKAN
jgi:hypothetical protein